VDETQEEDDDFSDDEGTEAELAALNADKIKDDDVISITSEDFTDEDDLPAPEELKHHNNSKLKGLWHSVENLRTKSDKEKVCRHVILRHHLSD